MGSRLEQKSNLVRKRIENHSFDDEDGEEYRGSSFGGFSEYFRRKKIKLQNLDAELRAQSSDKPLIFKGIVCHVNGYTQPSLNDLHSMIVQHGGGFMQYLDGKTMVTHIIASNLTPKKKEEFRRYRIVKPAWIVDSIKAGKVLPWDAYRVVDEGVNQKVLGFQHGEMVSQVNHKQSGYKEQSDGSWYTGQFKASSDQGVVSSLPASGRQSRSDEIDDEYALDVSSSVERAIIAADQDPAPLHGSGAADTASPFQDQTGVKTPSPAPSPSPQPAETSDPLRSRENSQEPDYSMAVVRNSDILNSIPPERFAQMTAEEHNAVLLSDPRIRKSTVVNPDFLEQYYRESRLHHLSTWKADLKSQLQVLTANESGIRKAKRNKIIGQRRYIMHVDFDSFFAAISLKKYPEFIDKPAVVAHGGGSGSEIASCNYPARAYGIHNGMWMKRAQALCADVKILPYDFPGYEDASRKFYDAIMATGGIVQSVSIDEALVDITTICLLESASDGVNRSEGSVDREQNKAETIAQHLRDEVLSKTGCAVSVGIGSNILQAKIALRKAKPAGQFLLRPEAVLDFIGQLEVQKLPGVAWSIGGKLEEIGIKLVKDIRETSKEKLVNALGPKTGEKIWEYARGIDRTEVGDQPIRKSVSAEVNWGVRFENQAQVDEFMLGLCGELHKRLIKERVKGKQLTMKIMRRALDAPLDPPKHLGHGKCDTFNKSLQLGVATNDSSTIAKEAISMLKSFGISPGELRGIGVQMQKLESIKAGADGSAMASQKKLLFKAVQEKVVNQRGDPIQDDGHSPDRSLVPEVNRPSRQLPIPNITPTKKPLNTTGTQFVMPTQVDPAVLAELPDDIRNKLMAPTRPASREDSSSMMDPETSRTGSRGVSLRPTIPNQSQIDPKVLDELPEDVRAEVLGYYQTNARPGGQALLPQSPRTNRTLPPIKTASKNTASRKRVGGLFAGRARNKSKDAGASTLTQSNFVSRHNEKFRHEEGASTTDTDGEPAPLDAEFLAALPEELRQEVLDEQRRARLQRSGGIDIVSKRKRPSAAPSRPLNRHVQLPPRPVKPTFTSRKLTEVADLREAVKAWYEEFSDEGPYNDDILALGKYLSAVITDERDLAKATSIAKWLDWVIAEHDGKVELDIQESWRSALIRIQEHMQQAVQDRGLGRVEF